MISEGELVMIRLPGTCIHGRLATITVVHPKRVRWPVLYTVLIDHLLEQTTEDTVESLVLKEEELWVLV